MKGIFLALLAIIPTSAQAQTKPETSGNAARSFEDDETEHAETAPLEASARRTSLPGGLIATPVMIQSAAALERTTFAP